MNVLSIDIDFITSSYGRFVDGIDSDFPNKNWDYFCKYRLAARYDVVFENNKNFKFIFDIFKNAIKKTDNVVFALEHQQIIEEFENIDSELEIYNIDQHHDIYYNCSDDEDIKKYNLYWCGDWIWWACNYKKVKKCHWIKNESSESYNIIDNKDKIPSNYKEYTLKTLDYDLNDINFDLIFVCLSPQYVHPKHWFYFDILKVLFEKEKNVEVDLKYDYIKYKSCHLSYKNFKLQSFFKNIKD